MSVSPTADLLQQAMALHRRGAIAEAVARYDQVLRADPSNADAHYYLGMISCQHGRFAEGIERARKSLAKDPRHAPAHALLGRALSGLGRNAEAIDSYDRALALAPNSVECWFNRGMTLVAVGRHNDAVASFDRVIAGEPDFMPAHLLRAKVLLDLRRHDAALAGVDKLLAVAPNVAEAWLGRSNILFELVRYDEALAACDRALAIKRDLIEAWHGRGNVLTALKRYDDALAAYDKVLALRPERAEAWHGRGSVLTELKRYDEALAAYDKALGLRPDFAEAWLGRGNVLNELKRSQEALAGFGRALALRADLDEAWLGRGNALNELRQHGEALVAYDKALALKPDLAGAWLGRGNVLTKLDRHGDALAAYDRAVALRPDLAEAWLGRGNVFGKLKQYDDALLAFDKAAALVPDLAAAWYGRGNVLYELKRYADAFAAYDKAVALQPDLNHAEGARLSSKLHICDWTDLEPDVAKLLAAIRQDKPASVPFLILTIPSSAADQLQCAARYVQDQPSFPPLWRGDVYSNDRIRVAYLSADFHEHATAQLAAGLFERHDRSRFDVTAISYGPDDNSEMRQRIKAAFEHFIDVRNQSDQDIAELVRRLEIDIAVDLKGFTRDSRFNILARRAAPIQVSYLGYPGTMGASYIDYVVADATTIPEDQCRYYTEQVVWLPESYQINDNRRRIFEHTPTRRECGLPDAGFVFCCFNNAYKIMPEIFDIWMRFLKATEGSVLWLLEDDAAASANLRREAEKRGVSSERLVFAARASAAEHLARQRRGNLFLDTLPVNAHTTASDALWAGLPVLTCLGPTFIGRVAGSLLKAVGLGELVTHSLAEYETLALKLAQDHSYLASLKDRLARNRNTCPLFDTEHVTRQIESAYQMMWDRYRRGEMPSARSDGQPSQPIRIV